MFSSVSGQVFLCMEDPGKRSDSPIVSKVVLIGMAVVTPAITH